MGRVKKSSSQNLWDWNKYISFPKGPRHSNSQAWDAHEDTTLLSKPYGLPLLLPLYLPLSEKLRRRQWHTTPVLLPWKSHGWRSLVGCSPWGRWGSDTTERLHFHFSLSCIGEGNGNPLQCSCLENPRDGEPGGLPSMGLHRVGYDWSSLAVAVAGASA